MNPFLIEDELKMKSHIFHISIQVFLNFLSLFFYFVPNISPDVAFRAKCKMFSRHLQKPILKTEKGRFKGL